MSYQLTAPAFSLPDGAQEFIDHVYAQPIHEWHPAPLSKRGIRLKGDTAAGQAIETILKIAVNNSDGPDIPRGRIEVKAGRASSTCPTTLLTKSPCFPKGANRMMVTNYGYPCEDDPSVTRLMVCLSAAQETTPRNGRVFKLITQPDRLVIQADNVVIAGYEKETLLVRAERKLGGMLAHFEAESRPTDDGHEEFRIKALNLYGGYSSDKLWKGIQSGTVVVEPRLKLTGSKVRDRGTAFRSAAPASLYAWSHQVI